MRIQQATPAIIVILLLAFIVVALAALKAKQTAIPKSHGTVTMEVTRGDYSWNYIYIFLGFALTIGGTVISMVPDVYPWNIVGFTIYGSTCVHLFLFNGWFQNALFAMKQAYESVGR